MSRIVVFLLAAAIITVGCGGSAGSSSGGASASPRSSPSDLTSIGAGLEGPPGLVAAVYATGIAQVAAFAFDSQARLWVASAAYTDTGKDGVYLVPSAGADPVAVISGLHTALGLLWDGGSLYVASSGGVVARVVANGQAWGFPACYGQGGSACIGVPNPVAVLDKHAAVSGVAIVGGQLGGSTGSAAIVAEWASGKVQRVVLAG